MNNTSSMKSATLHLDGKQYWYYPISQVENLTSLPIQNMPYSIRILIENLIRKTATDHGTLDELKKAARWNPELLKENAAIGFTPGRVLLQDLTGVPVIVDLASLRASQERRGKDPKTINPKIPVDLIVDHSLQVDYFGNSDVLEKNQALEYQRNGERYKLLKWAQQSFSNLRIVPPGTGIIHQVNLEYLASVILTALVNGKNWIYPDTVVGTDSHSTMINGLGVLGWGVGGIEAIAAMLGQPVEIPIPDVVGVRLSGEIQPGVLPTDIVLTLTHTLRKFGVVNKFVEFFGPALDTLTVPDRAMLSNMAPEYGATVAYFPVDEQTIKYLKGTARSSETIELIKAYYTTQGLYRTKDSPEPVYTEIVELDLSTIKPSVAGPKRPQDLINLDQVSGVFLETLKKPTNDRGYNISPEELDISVNLSISKQEVKLTHGSVVLAAITSCTNTSNPAALISAGLLAKNAIKAGLRTKPYVKTSFTPGSKVVIDYLNKAGLMSYLEDLGFFVSGIGCATCIGNSGPLHEDISKAIENNHLITAAVISGNRNFEGRVHPQVQANFLASPALVVAYAIVGNIQKNIATELVGYNTAGEAIYLSELMPELEEIKEIEEQVVHADIFRRAYVDLFKGDERWQGIISPNSDLYQWEENSTYLKQTPFCEPAEILPEELHNVRALAVFGDSITTDHISPAGAISNGTPAARYLQDQGLHPAEFNTYGSRRGNHEVMMRGTFANIRIQNTMIPGIQGGKTIYLPDQKLMDIYDAAMLYKNENVPLIILAGKEYGTGSSRDWAAKGPKLLGVRAVLAESFERIHRSNLAGMGILPLQFHHGDSISSLELTGREIFSIHDLDQLAPSSEVRITAIDAGKVITFSVRAAINSEYEVSCIQKGGIFQLLD